MSTKKPQIPEAPGDVRQSREAEAREQSASRMTTEAPKQWTPPRRLSAPKPPPGMHYRWLRASLNGDEDRDNFHMRQREGFTLVKAEDINNQQFPTLSDGPYKGYVGQGGLVLAQIPIEIVKQREQHYKRENVEQASKHSKEFRKGEHAAMPLDVVDEQRRSQFAR